MSDIKHVIVVGASIVGGIDDSYTTPHDIIFTAAETTIFADSITRYANETN